MADIHIGSSIFNKEKDQVDVEIFFHVPNTQNDNAYPGLTENLDGGGNVILVSSAPGILDTELTKLKEGSLLEYRTTKLFKLEIGIQAIKSEIQGLWQPVADREQARIDKDYKFYGTLLARGGV